MAPCSEQVSDVVGVSPPVGGTKAPLLVLDSGFVEAAGAPVLVVLDLEVEETVALPIASVVVSVEFVVMPVMSVALNVSPSVVVTSGTPGSGVVVV
jgi:hypothetical protein